MPNLPIARSYPQDLRGRRGITVTRDGGALTVGLDDAAVVALSGQAASVKVADAAIPAWTAVIEQTPGKILPANPGDPAHMGKVIGVVSVGGNVGDSLRVVSAGSADGPLGVFSAGPLWIGPGGALTSVLPSGGWVQQVARAYDASRVVVGLGRAYQLTPEIAPAVPLAQNANLWTVAPSSSGAQAYALQERADDEVSVMSFMPKAVRAAVRARWNDGATLLSSYLAAAPDVTDYFRRALATGKSVRVPAGDYKITDKLTLGDGQEIRGDGIRISRLLIGYDFKISASAVIDCAPGTVAPGIDGVSVVFCQDAASSAAASIPLVSAGYPDYAASTYAGAVAAARAALIRYPWALDITAATRFRIGRFQAGAAWDGIKGTPGNCGGLVWDTVEIGAFNRGITLGGFGDADSPLDFCHISTIHLWPFAIAGKLLWVFLDGIAVGMDIGRVDGLDIKSLNSFGQRVVANNGGATGLAGRQISMMQLDGDGAEFQASGGDWQIGFLSSTKGAWVKRPNNFAVTVTTGQVDIAQVRLRGSNPVNMVQVTGGCLTISGGSLEQLDNIPCVNVEGAGTAIIQNCALMPWQNAVRTAPFLSGNGAPLVARNNVATTSGSGHLVKCTTDIKGNVIQNNHFNGYSILLPADPTVGYYSNNTAVANPVLGTVTVGRA